VKREKDNLMNADKWLWFKKNILLGFIHYYILNV
jgi:hypothetical protein